MITIFSILKLMQVLLSGGATSAAESRVGIYDSIRFATEQRRCTRYDIGENAADMAGFY